MKFVVPFVFAGLLLGPSAAMAAGELGLSTDRVHWSPNLTTPLFDPNFRWVPGDRETSSFWVRNQSSNAALLDVNILGSSVDTLMKSGDLAVTVTAANSSGTSTTIGRHALISSQQVDPGQTQRIDVTVAFDRAATNQSQVTSLDMRFEVRLTQDTSGSNTGGGNGGHGHGKHHGKKNDGSLPGTGGPAWWVLPSGAIGIATGLVIVAAARRKEAADV